MLKTDDEAIPATGFAGEDVRAHFFVGDVLLSDAGAGAEVESDSETDESDTASVRSAVPRRGGQAVPIASVKAL